VRLWIEVPQCPKLFTVSRATAPSTTAVDAQTYVINSAGVLRELGSKEWVPRSEQFTTILEKLIIYSDETPFTMRHTFRPFSGSIAESSK
jgi:hypothetical protein